MRIAQVAPLAESVPPRLYGGTERVVSWLTEELVSLGHDVTLFASGDSVTSAELVPIIPSAIRLSRPRPESFPAYAAQLDAVARTAHAFDIVHSHIDWIHLPILSRLDVPHITTCHNRLDTPDLPPIVNRFPHAPLVSISDDHRRLLPNARWLGTVYHGMPLNEFRPSWVADGYLVFVGRLSREKGPETAIRLAKAAGLPLRIAAKVPRSETRYYRERIEPLIDGAQIELLGELDDTAKGALMSKASALLFPIDWPEPFGLVMIEAMACGAPVIAFRRGSVPEVIDDGLTGFVVDSEQEAVAAIRRLAEIDRRQVRATFERRFSVRRMAEEYLALYEALVKGRMRRRGAQSPPKKAVTPEL